MYIYRQKYSDSQINVINFLIHLRHRLDIERKICEKNNRVGHFEKKWSNILALL